MAEYNSFTYDEIKSSDFGVYIGGEKTFDAPSLRGQSIEIPGRNGNVFISSDSYENVELVYPSFNFEPDLETFRSKLAKLRNALSSRASYKRLTDTLHPDEFRMAVFRDGFEVKPIKYNTAAEFDIVFDCKPQRFLKSGEIPVEYTPGQTPSDEQTKTGSIVTFEAEEGTIISDIKADINPVQDLHGYDKPWAGGNGKNKLDYTNETDFSNEHIRKYHLSLPIGTYTISAACYSSSDTDCVSLFIYTDDTSSQAKTLKNGNWSSVTIDATKEVKEFRIYSSINYANSQNYALSSINNLQVEEGSQATSYEPYANICPISGLDSVKVTRTGKNLLNYDVWKTSAVLNGSAVWENNGVTLTATANDCYTQQTSSPAGARVAVSEGETVTLSWESDATTANNGRVYIFPNGSTSGLVNANATTGTLSYTVGSGITYITFRVGVAISGNTIHYRDIMIRKSGDATYEPYQGDTYTTALGRTVYGGTLDVVSGVLTVDRAMVDLESLTYSRLGSTVFRFQATLTGSKGSGDNTKAGNIISDIYKTDSWSQITNVNGNTGIAISSQGGTIAIQDNNYADASSFKTAMSGHQLCYELATPQTYQLTPTEVKTLLGTNNIWADSGDITVKYGTSPYIIVNPTDFPSKPLLEVTGVGSFWLGDTQITITGTSGQIIYIDCETGECYKVTGGIISPANGLVTLNRLDFPKLASGINNIQLGSGISKVKITPRWWRL